MENFQHYQYSRLPLTLGTFKECFIPDMISYLDRMSFFSLSVLLLCDFYIEINGIV